MSADADDSGATADSLIETLPITVFGYVLAGGRSSRMGTDKATIDIDGRSALQRQVDLISRWCNSGVGIVGSGLEVQSRDGRPIVVLIDRSGRQGPLDGLITALDHAATSSATRSALALVVAVDLWNISDDAMRRLFAVFADPVLGPETDVAYLHGSDGSGDQPLAALWRVVESLEVLTGAFESGERSVVRAWMGLRRTAVVVSESVVANVNTPEDVERWRSLQAEIADPDKRSR